MLDAPIEEVRVARQTEWQIPCRDAMDRQRSMTVRLDGHAGDRVGLRLPAGESASLDVDAAVALLAAVGRVLGLIRYGTDG